MYTIQYTLAACNQSSCLRNFFSLLQLICSFIGVVLPMSWFCRLVFFFVLILLLFFYTFLPQTPEFIQHLSAHAYHTLYVGVHSVQLFCSDANPNLLGHLLCFFAKQCPSSVSHVTVSKTRGLCQFTPLTRKLKSANGASQQSRHSSKLAVHDRKNKHKKRCSCANACTQNKMSLARTAMQLTLPTNFLSK